ncbi:MAG: DNA mismatch repair endonuclease MutL [Candidatus Calescibacterium sp.]|nr:DNA mismatch repair endonuclease MutL [Candidatus Calescibacterium sp.]MDW8086388.1 DNA mismatch repair endonuclease MutL [Candidatus Calescibacterium sp.]
MKTDEQKIFILPEKVASLIAAGEVIDRPSAVVKELVENSIDANATQIDVNVKGKDFISVFDNGDGMSEKDAVLCLHKHATSKISKEEDLNFITTFGFRGEALFSIATVSKIIIRTRTKNQELGTEVSAEGGKITHVKKLYIEPGTQIIVKDLFYNTPARKKFLSTDQVEFSYITEVVSRYALAFPNIGFKLTRDGETVLNLKPRRSLEETIKSLFGENKNSSKIDINFHVGNIGIEGIIWGEKTGIGKWIFLNKRYIRDKTVFSAISKFNFLKNSDYIIFINAPPEMYDVNVNPTKTEVRWRAPTKIKELIITSIEEAIRHRYLARIETSDTQKYITEEQNIGLQDNQKTQISQSQTQAQMTTNTSIFEHKKALKVLAVIKGIFSIVEFDGEIYFVDLHAYHEGRYFRELKEKFQKIQKNEVLRFAIPFEVTLPKNVIMKILDRKEDFEKIGLNISADIENSKIKISSIPYYLSGFELSDFLMEFSEGFEMKKIENFLAGVACRTVIRSGDKLDHWDILQILQDFDVDQRCPHGRPAVIKLDIEELEKKFGRC